MTIHVAIAIELSKALWPRSLAARLSLVRTHTLDLPVLLLLPSALLLLSACFPALHNALVEPGLRLGAGLTLFTDQRREGREQGSGGILTLAPVLGIRDRVEVGLSIGVL